MPDPIKTEGDKTPENANEKENTPVNEIDIVDTGDVNTNTIINTGEFSREEAIKRSFEPLESRTAKSSSEDDAPKKDD